MAEPEHGSSPLAEALARVGDRWTLLVVEALLDGPGRFNDLLGQIPGIAANILSERLKRLEREERRLRRLVRKLEPHHLPLGMPLRDVEKMLSSRLPGTVRKRKEGR